MSMIAWNDAKAGIEVLLLEAFPELENSDIKLDKLVKEILEICHVSKK
jgi:hypothetical protein